MQKRENLVRKYTQKFEGVEMSECHRDEHEADYDVDSLEVVDACNHSGQYRSHLSDEKESLLHLFFGWITVLKIFSLSIAITWSENEF
jgi:hypothetical protein